MTKVAKSLMFFLISVVLIAGISIGAVVLLNKKPNNVVPSGPTYTEEEKDFIASIESGMKSLKTAEPIELVATSSFALSEIYDVKGDYVVAKDKENGNSKAMAVYKRNGTSLTKIVGNTGSEYCRVFDVYGDYALVSNNLSDYSGAFLLNLKTKERIGAQVFNNYVDANAVSIGGATYEVRYQFVGDYFIEIYTNYVNSEPCQYKFNVVNLKNGTTYDLINTGEEKILKTGEIVLDYSISFGYFVIKTTRKSAVYKLGEVSLDLVYPKDSQGNTMETVVSGIYDYRVGESLYYFSTDEFNFTPISENKILINHLVAASANDENITIKLKKNHTNTSLDENADERFKYVSQEVFVYDVKKDSFSDSISYANEYLEVYESKLDGFALLVGTKIFAENDYKIQYDGAGGLILSDITARYLDTTSLKKVIEYDYKAYGPVMAYVNHKLICLKDSGYSSYIISPIDFNGNKLSFGNFDLENYRVYNNSFGDNQFVFGGTKCGVADFDGNVLTTVSTATNISFVFSDRLIYQSGYENKYFLKDLLQGSDVQIENIISVVNGVGENHTNNIEGYKQFGPIGFTPGSISYYGFALQKGMRYYFTYNFTDLYDTDTKYYVLNDIGGMEVPSSFANIKNYFYVNQENGFDIIYESGDSIYLLSSEYVKETKQETIAQSNYAKNNNVISNSVQMQEEKITANLTSNAMVSTSAQQVSTTPEDFANDPEIVHDDDLNYDVYVYNIDNLFQCDEKSNINQPTLSEYLPKDELFYYVFNMKRNNSEEYCFQFGLLNDIDNAIDNFLKRVTKIEWQNQYFPICKIKGVSAYDVNFGLNNPMPAFKYDVILSGKLVYPGGYFCFKVDINLVAIDTPDYDSLPSENYCFSSGDLTSFFFHYTLNLLSSTVYEIANYDVGHNTLTASLEFVYSGDNDVTCNASPRGITYIDQHFKDLNPELDLRVGDFYYPSYSQSVIYAIKEVLPYVACADSKSAGASGVTLSTIGYGQMSICRGKTNPHSSSPVAPLFSKKMSIWQAPNGVYYTYGFNNANGVENTTLPFDAVNYDEMQNDQIESGIVIRPKNGVYIFEKKDTYYIQFEKRQYINSNNIIEDADGKIKKQSRLNESWSWDIIFCDAFTCMTFWDDCGTTDTSDDYDMVEFALKNGNSGFDSATGKSGAVFYEGRINSDGSRKKLETSDLQKLFPTVNVAGTNYHYYTVFYDAYGKCYGIQNGVKIKNNLPFYIKKPGYEAVGYSLQLAGDNAYKSFEETYYLHGTNDTYTSMFKFNGDNNSQNANAVAYLSPIFTISGDGIVDAIQYNAVISFRGVNYLVSIDTNAMAHFSKLATDQLFKGTLGQNYYYTNIDGKYENIITIVDEDGDSTNNEITFYPLDENGNKTSIPVTISKQNPNYLFSFNNNITTPLKAVWKEQKYSVVLYAEEEKIDGQELLGATNDWYYYSPTAGENVATGFASDNIKNVSDFINPTTTPAYIGDNYIRNSIVLTTKKDGENKNIFSVNTELKNWPIPTKIGYSFVGWRPMKYDAETNKMVSVAEKTVKENLVGPAIGGGVVEPIYYPANAFDINLTILTADDGSELFGFEYSGNTLTSFKDYPIAIDFDNPNSEIYFKAVFELTHYDVTFRYLNDINYFPEGAHFDDKWINTELFIRTNLQNGIAFSLKSAFGADGKQQPTIYDLSNVILPRMQYSDWIINNLLYTMTNARNSEGIFDINYISNNNGTSINMDGEKGYNDDFVAASKFNLVCMLTKMNMAIKNKAIEDDRPYYADTINQYESITGEMEYYASCGYNTSKLSLDITAQSLSKYFEVFNDSTTSVDSQMVPQGDIVGTADRGLDGDPAIISSASGAQYDVPYGKYVFIKAEAIPLQDWTMNELKIVVFTGNNVLGDTSKDEVLVIPYSIIWKNNMYYAAVQGNPYFADAAALQAPINYSDILARLSEVAALIGCKVNEENGKYIFKDINDNTPIVGLTEKTGEVGKNIPYIRLSKLANYAGTNNVGNYILVGVDTQGHGDNQFITYESVKARAVQLRFTTKATTYDVVAKVLESGTVTEPISSNLLNAAGVSNSGVSTQINVGAISYYGRGEFDDMAYNATYSTLNPNYGSFNLSGSGVTVVPLISHYADEEGTSYGRWFDLLGGGIFGVSLSDIQTVRYTHFISRVIMADLDIGAYNEATKKFTISGLTNIIILDLAVSIEFNVATGELIFSITPSEVSAGVLHSGGVSGEPKVINIGSGGTGSLFFGINQSTFKCEVKRTNEDELIIAKMGLELNAWNDIYKNDKMLICEFMEYEHSYATVTETKDGNETTNYVLGKNRESDKGGYNQKISYTTTEEKVNAIESSMVNSTTTITYAVEAPLGYYLKTLKITTPAGNSSVILSGYPTLKNDGTVFNYFTLLGYYDNGVINNEDLHKGGYDGDQNSYGYKTTFLSVLARRNEPNNYSVLAFDTTTKLVSADHALIFNIMINGFYGGVNIETEFESLSAIKVNNAMVSISAENGQASNLDSLDYILKIKGEDDFEEINVANQTLDILPTTILSGNYYIATTNSGYAFVIIGKGNLNISIEIKGAYLPYEDIGSVISANDAETPIDYAHDNENEKKSNILTSNNINMVSINIERYEYNLTLLVELGYYSGTEENEVFSSYAGVYKYSENNAAYLSLLAKRLDLSANYYGKNSNPVGGQAAEATFYKGEDGARVAIVENNGYVYGNTESKTFAYYNLVVLKGTAVNLPFGVLSGGYEAVPEIYLAETISGSSGIMAKTSDRNNKESGLIENDKITLDAIEKTNEQNNVVVLLRFEAKPYSITYKPYKEDERPETFSEGERVAINGATTGENSFYDAEGNIVGITKQTWFDSKIVESVNYIKPETLTITGHTAGIWVASKQVDGANEIWTALSTSYSAAQNYDVDELQIENGDVKGYGVKHVTVNYSNIINEDFISDPATDTEFSVYMHWNIVKIYIRVSLNDSRDVNGSTSSTYETYSNNPINIDQTVPFIYNQLYSAKINFSGFARNGYDFKGLGRTGGKYDGSESLITNESKVVLTNAEIAAGTGTASKPLMLYAKWQPWIYRVRYYLPGIALVIEGDLANSGKVQSILSLNEGSVERFTSATDQTNYSTNSGEYCEYEIEFDSAIPYLSVACAGYDLIGWFIDVNGKDAEGGVVSVNLKPSGETPYYYAMLSSSNRTSLIWYFLMESGELSPDSTPTKNGIDYTRVVKIETRWRLQGVKIRLVTKYVPDGEDYSSADPQTQRNGNAINAEEKRLLNNLSNTKRNSLLTYLLKDYDDGNNGVTNNFYTRSATVIKQTKNDKGEDVDEEVYVYYDCVIDYYAPIGSTIISFDRNGASTLLTAPTADGYIFCGYYYYDTTTKKFDNKPRITANSSGQCLVSQVANESNFNIFQEDNTIPLVFYACWQIKSFNITMQVDNSQQYLLSNRSTWYPLDGGYQSTSVLDLVADLVGLRLNNEKTEAMNTSNKYYDVNGVLNFTANFYDTFDIYITMPEGHYLSSINGQSCTWIKKDGNYHTSFVALNSHTNSSSVGEPLGSNDRIIFAEGLYNGSFTAASYNVQTVDGARSDNAGKLDIKATTGHVVASYPITLKFSRQNFQVSVVQIVFDKEGNRTSKTITLTPEDGVIEYWKKFDTDAVSAGPQYQRGDFFTDSTLKTLATNMLEHIVENVTVYQRIDESDPERIEVQFYGWSPIGYQQIPTGFEYVFAATQDGGDTYINGGTYGGKVYKWTNAIEGDDIRATIVKFPVLTSFYWPTMVDNKTTGIRFAYWVRFGAKVDVSINPNKILTPAYITNTYGKIDSEQTGTAGDQSATYSVFCIASDPNSFTATFQAGDRYYAVFECVDNDFSIAEVEMASQTEDNKENIIADNNVNKIVKIKQNPLISSGTVPDTGGDAYTDYLGISLSESGIDISSASFPELELYYMNVSDGTELDDIASNYLNAIAYISGSPTRAFAPTNAIDSEGKPVAMTNTSGLYFKLDQEKLGQLQNGFYVARVKVVSSSGYVFYSTNVFVFEVMANTKTTSVTYNVSGSSVNLRDLPNGATVYNHNGSYYTSAPSITIKAIDVLGPHEATVSYGATSAENITLTKWCSYSITTSVLPYDVSDSVTLQIITTSVLLKTT